ncbi:ORC2-domain-containing protein [Microthyrium microscopicum]|uniref:Origin recognition complex subunit 2 n=1 Tax=Microthyrium microscopicum TaxID=703497 RepID=A0A6A6UCF8_9PEZI|nr:ORC2-domain-containing protein [Microthyrium microscopicum]
MKRKRGQAQNAQKTPSRSPSAVPTPASEASQQSTPAPPSRRKGHRALRQQQLVDQLSDDPERGQDDLAAHIWDDGETAAQTPSKPRRGRKKKEKELSPMPQNLPPNERYFWENRPGANKTSNNTLPPNVLLNHDDFFTEKDDHEDPHEQELRFLLSLHEAAFEQWSFELSNKFNLCLYGYGSKRTLTDSFAEYLADTIKPSPKIVMVNGFVPNLTPVDILNAVAGTIIPVHIKLPSSAANLLDLILETLDSQPPKSPIFLFINSIDAASIRRPNTQAILATLASQESIRMISTADTPNFPLLWDVSLRTKFKFLFHDCTTFVPFSAEMDTVETVNELLGRSGRRLGGRDGIGFVLRSLPENARHLFRILVAGQIASSVDDGLQENDVLKKADANKAAGVEYRVLYHKAREELVCSTEHQLRTLLKEFYDHQMVESQRDALGTERLLVPFRQEELESLLEDLVE